MINMYLFDTNILIDHLKGLQAATVVLQRCIESKIRLACSVITVTELMSGLRNEDEQQQLELFLSGFEKLDVTLDIACQAGQYVNQFRKSHGVNIADAIIAATAKLNNIKLYTLNTKHYPMSDITVIKPY